MHFEAIDSFQTSIRLLLIIAQLHVTVQLNRASVTAVLHASHRQHLRSRITAKKKKRKRKKQIGRENRKYEAQRTKKFDINIETDKSSETFYSSIPPRDRNRINAPFFQRQRSIISLADIRTVIKTSINTILLINRSNHLLFDRPLSIKKNMERPKYPSTRSKYPCRFIAGIKEKKTTTREYFLF